jgi:hypothetical protein
MLVAGKWYCNSIRFATEKEAADYAADLFMRWTQPTEHRTAASDEPVTYCYTDGTLRPVKENVR